MTEIKFDLNLLESIFGSMVHTMDQSKNDIFIISEQNRESFEEMKKELEEVEESMIVVTTEGNYLETMTHDSRKRLADVSKNFMKYSEVQVREAYEVANDLLVRLSVNRMEERRLRERREDLEKRLAALLDTIERADQLISQVAIVVNYLTSDLKNVGVALANAKHKQGYGIRIIHWTHGLDERQQPRRHLRHHLARRRAVARRLDDPGREAAHRRAARGDGRRRHRGRLPDRLQRRLRGGARDRQGWSRDASVCGLARAGARDIDRAGEALKPAPRGRASTPSSPPAPLHMKYKLQMEPEEVHQARHRQRHPRPQALPTTSSGRPRTATRTEHDFLLPLRRGGDQGRAPRTINIPDTVGYAVPEEFGDADPRMLRERVPNVDKAVFSMHCHNDLGLAVANSLAGGRAPARGRSSAPSTASASAPATPRWKRS